MMLEVERMRMGETLQMSATIKPWPKDNNH